MPAPAAVRPARPAAGAHYVAYHQEPARRPMMAIMNPSHAAVTTPCEPAGPRPKKRTPRPAQHTKALAIGADSGVFLPPGSASDVHAMMRSSVSTAATVLPAITPRGGNRAARPRGRALDLNLEDSRHGPSSARAGHSHAPNASPAESRRDDGAGFSPEEIDSPSALHTWIDPVTSRPTTREGKETSGPPSQRLENEVDPRERSPLERFVYVRQEKSQSERSPELIPVPGIGSVSVRLAGDKDECVVDYGMDVDERLPADGLPAFRKHEPAGNEQLDPVQWGEASDYDRRVVEEYRATSAYFVQGYATKEGLPGVGFSKNLMRLSDPRSRIFQYPTPSEALQTMSKRPHERVDAPSSHVAMVGTRPPSIDQTFYTLQQMKRQWLMQYSKEEKERHQNIIAPRSSPQLLAPIKRPREPEGTDQFVRTPPAGSVRPARQSISSRPGSKEQKRDEAKNQDQQNFGGSVNSPWMTSPADADVRASQYFDARTASKPSHGYSPTGSPNGRGKSRGSDSVSIQECIQEAGLEDEPLSPFPPAMPLSPGRPDAMMQGNAALAMHLSPIGEFSLDSTLSRESPQLQLGLSIQQVETHAMLQLASQGLRTPVMGPQQVGTSSPTTPWADKMQSDAGLFAAGQSPIEEEGLPVPPGRDKGLSHISRQSPHTLEGQKGMQVLGPGQLAAGFDFFEGSGNGTPTKPRRAISSSPKRHKTERSSDRRVGPDHQVFAKPFEQQEDVLFVNSPYIGGGYSLVGEQPGLRPANEISLQGHKRHMIIQEMQKKHIISDGNRALIRCEEELSKKHLKNAVRDHELACQFFGKADVLLEKHAILSDLHFRILEITREYHAYQQMQAGLSVPPASDAVPTISVPFRGPDRLQPDGLHAKSREEYQEMRRATREEEIRRRDALMEVAKQQAELAAKLQLQEEEERARHLEEARVRAEQLEAARLQGEEELRRLEAEMAERRMMQEETIEAQGAAEEARRLANQAEEERQLVEQKLKEHLREGRRQVMAEAKHLLEELTAAEERRALAELQRITEFAEQREGFELVFNPILHEMAASMLKELREETQHRKKTQMVGELIHHLLEKVHKEAGRRENLAHYAIATERETAASVERLICELEAVETAGLAQEVQDRRAREAEAEAYLEVQELLDDLIDRVEAIVCEEMEAEARRRAEEEVARAAAAFVAATEAAPIGCSSALLDEVVFETLLAIALETRDEVEEEETAERMRREEEQRLAEEERLRREEEEELAKLDAITILQACARRIKCGNLHAETLVALFAEEELVRQEEERKRREEDERLATQRAAEMLQATVRCKVLRDEFVDQHNASLIFQALCRRERHRLLYGQMLQAAVTIQDGAKTMLSRRRYRGKQSAAAALQGLLKMYSLRAQFRRDKDNVRVLQAYMLSHLGQVNLGAGLKSQLLLSSYIRMQLPRRIFANYCHGITILLARVRLKVMPTSFSEMQASASALQTCCRRMFAAKDLNRKLAVNTLEPFLLSSNARNAWSSRLLAASKLVWNLRAASLNANFSEMCQAADFLQRITQRNVDVSVYHSQALEAREEHKRVEEAEKARKREEEVAAKQKQIMERMEANKKAMHEAAEVEAAKELERKKMVAEYSHKAVSVREEPTKKKEPKEIAHVKREDNEAFALAVGYEKEKMYDKAIAVLLKIMRVPALRMTCLLKRATCLGKLGMRRDCLKDFQSAIREFPDEHLPFYMRALHHVQWQNDSLAMRDIASALAIDPKHTESLNLQASLKFKHGYFVEAAMLATRTLEMKSDIAQLYIIRGLSRERLGLMKEARDDLATAIIMTLDALPRLDTQVGEDDLKSLATTLTDNVFVTFCDACLVGGIAGAQQAVEVLKRFIDFTGTRSAVFAMRARAYCAMDRFEDAEEDFEKAENVEEDNPHFLIARAQFTRHTDPASAIRDCERAAKVDPENLRAHVVEGKIYEEEQRSKEAVAAYKEALRREDTGIVHYEAAMRCGALQYKIAESSGAKKQEALSLLRDAARVHAPREDPLLTLARFLESAGSYSSAIRSLTRVIHMNPSDPRTYVLRSKCLLLSGNTLAAMRDRQTAMLLDNRVEPDVIKAQIDALIDAQDFARALAKVKHAVAAHPGHAHFKILQGKVLFLSGEIDAAKKMFDEGLRGGNAVSQDFESRGEFLLQTGSASAAEHDFERSIELDQTNTASYIGLGEARLKTGNSNSAAEGLDGALQLDPHNKRALHLRAMVYEKHSHFSDALAVYEKILFILESEQTKGKKSLKDLLRQAESQKEHEYYFLEAHMKAGLLCTKMRDFLGAIEHYNHVLKVNRKSFQALLHRGIAFHSHGYHESAIGDYNRALALNPANSIVLQNRAKAFAAQKEWNRAIADIDAIKESERDAGVFALLSSCYSATSQKENALKAIDASLQLDGLSLHALISKADILEDLYPLQRAAMSCYSRALRLHAGSQLARLKHALAAAKRGFIDVAIKEVRGARAVADTAGNNEREKIVIEELDALIMVEASMPVTASVILDKLLASKQNDVAMRASLFTARGVMHQQGKDMVTARSDFALAVQADPSDPEAHYNLGCFRMQEMDWRGAYASFTKTLSLRPKHTLAMLNRGVTLYQMHRAQEALSDFNAALALQPDFGQALLNRGVMHQISGSHAEAEKDLSRAIVLLGGSKEALQSRANFYQSVGRKDLSLRDNASLIALSDEDA